MSAVMTPAGFTDYKVADISLAAWGRREIIIEFVHLHLYTFAPSFRVHVGIRVLNDPFEAAALNGPDSHGMGFRLEFDAVDSAVDECASEIARYCKEVGELWFARWRDHPGTRFRRRFPAQAPR